MGRIPPPNVWIPAAFAFGAFVIFGTFAWFGVSRMLPLWIGYSLYAPTVPMYVFEEVRILLAGSASALVGACCYIALLQYLYRRQSTTMAEALVAELELSVHQLQLLYDNSPVPYFVMDDEGNIRNANKATLRFFGGVLEELEVANIYNMIKEVRHAHGGEGLSFLRAKVQRGVPVTGEEAEFRTLRGEKRIALISIYSVGRRSLLPYRHLVALTDVTKERQNEEAKTDFLLLASHQLRTPTTTIKWYADYLLESKSLELPKEVREYLQEIFNASERMTDLISTLLTVSHIEMGTLSPEFASASPGAIVDDLLRELSPDVAKRHHKVTREINDVHDVVTDGRMVRIAIHNLLTNAIKYTPEGGTIGVRVTQTPTSTTIAVSDGGVGIPLAEQDQIFSKMFRATNAKKVSGSGTGLGLYLTKSFVEKLGGTITFASIEGRGTTFTITIPNVAPGT